MTRHDEVERSSVAGELTRQADGRWTGARRSGEDSVNGKTSLPIDSVPDPATTELAVTRARTETEAEWEAVNHYDPEFEAASDRFFETDPGNRLTFEHLAIDDVGSSAVSPDPEPSHDPYHPQPRYGSDQQEAVNQRTNDTGFYEPEVPDGHRYQAVDGSNGIGGTVAGAEPGADDFLPNPGFGRHPYGYDAMPIDLDEPEIDETDLVTGATARRNAIEWAVVLVAAVLLALVLRALVLQAFWIPSPSMEDTLLIEDRVLVNKLSYRFGEVGRGDIVVFHRTDEEIASAGPSQPKDVIKRVIALGGETIEIRESTVYINDDELVEPYLEPGLLMPDFGPLTVPEGFLFVMGDNRNLSSDSRGELGPIAEDRVVGRAFVLFWPVNRASRL